jgi:Fe-S-cluster containining protein
MIANRRKVMSGRPNGIRLLADGEAAPVGCALVEGHVPYLGQAAVFRATVPAGPATLQDAAPLARAICDDFVRRIIRGIEGAGGKITCSKGCGACCSSFLVPMTVPEALRLIEDLQALPQRERRRLERLFLQAERKLAESDLAGQMASLDPYDPASTAQQRELAGKWWSQNRFPCPLLAGNACGLYRSRPIPCREFLALSDPQCCATNTETRAARPFSMHQVVAAWAAEFEGTRPTLVLMANLLGWWQHNAERAQRTWPGPILIRRLMEVLTQTARKAVAGSR